MIPRCACPSCRALAECYKDDPALLTHCQENLLVRGWAGRPDPIEKA